MKVEVQNDTSVIVTWDPLLLTEITEYIVYYRQIENVKRQTTESNRTVSSSQSYVIIDELITGGEYQFQVVAQATVDERTIVGKRSLLTDASIILLNDTTTLPICTASFSE